LSRSIQTLEHSLGHQLLVRTRSRVELTDNGKVVAQHAEIMLRERERMQDALLRLDSESVREIRVGLGQYPAECFGIEAAAALGSQQGRLLCQLKIADYRQITEDLLSGKIDLGLCDITLAREDKRIRCSPVTRMQLFGYCRPGHPLQARTPANLRNEDLFLFPLVATNIPARIKGPRAEPIHHIDPLTHEVLPALNSVTPAVAARLLDNSDAIAFAPLSMIERELDEKRVALLPLRNPQLHVDVGHIFNATREPDATMLRFMEESVRLAALHEQRSDALEMKYGVAAPRP
jgi:DNA-binding transcriptional LysR family regulator